MANDEPTGEGAPEKTPESAVAIGTRIIETYEIQKLINVGGMGEVYRGINIHTQDPVAIKIVLPALAHDPKISALFQKEAQVLGRLNHDSIVRYHIYTFDKGIGRPCLVMEFVEGVSLTDHLDSGPMPEDEVRRLIRRLAEGLGMAHKAGTVHRDLTPNNVILPHNSVDEAKIIDFGIAKTTTAGSGTVLQGQFAGTLNFVSPEQLGDFGGTIDARSDIYSLALLAAACCRGETLDMGTSVVEAVNRRRGVPDVSDVYPDLRPVLSRMLEPNPANRPASMAEVIELLDAPPETIPHPAPAAPAQPTDRTVIAPMPSMPPAGDVWTTPPAATPGYTNPPPAQPGYSTPPSPTPAPASQPPVGGLGQPGIGEPGVAPQQPPGSIPPQPQSVAPVGEPARRKKRSALPILLVLLAAIGGGGYYAYQAGLIPGFAPVPPVPPNAAPVAAADSGETEAGARIVIDVLANDSDPDGDPLSLTSVVQPGNGTATIDGNRIAYVPAEGFDGDDSFSYSISDGKGGEASASVKVAVAKPVVVEVDPLAVVAEHVDFLTKADLGDCTYLDPGKASPERVTAQGFGFEAAPFEKLVQDFESKRSAALDIGVRLVNPAQCAALDFVKDIREVSDDRPGLILDRDVLISGEQIRGTVKGFKNRDLWLFLVDGDGGAYDISSLVERLGDNVGTFGMQIQLTAGSDPAPELLVMVLTDKPITTAKAVRNGSPARTLLPLVEQELAATGLNPSAAIAYFRLEN